MCKDNNSEQSAPAMVNRQRGIFCNFINYLNLSKSCDQSSSREEFYQPQNIVSKDGIITGGEDQKVAHF
jgi:hypothetical protein